MKLRDSKLRKIFSIKIITGQYQICKVILIKLSPPKRQIYRGH